MPTIKYLSQVLKLTQTIENKKEQLVRLEQRMLYTSPTFETKEGTTSNSPSIDKIPKLLADKEALEESIEKLEVKLQETRSRLMRMIDSLEDYDCSDVLYLRYIRGQDFATIASIMKRKKSWVYHKHTLAVDMFAVKIKEFRRNPKRYDVLDYINGEIVFTGTSREVADYLGKSQQIINHSIAQRLLINKHLIIDHKQEGE